MMRNRQIEKMCRCGGRIMSGTRRTQMTRQLFRDSLIELLQTKPFQKITVKEICEQADLNRTTFYLHYDDQDQLLDDIVGVFKEGLDRYFPPISDKTDRINRLNEYLLYVKENYKIFRILMSNDQAVGKRKKILEDLLSERISAHKPKDSLPEGKYIYYFILEGSISMVLHWIDYNFDLRPEDLARQIDELCYPVFERYFC